MSLKWKISAELISAGGVKGGEGQLPLAVQDGQTDGQTDTRTGPATSARLGLAAAPGGRKET